MKLVVYPLAALLGTVGIVLILGNQGFIIRIIEGVILLATAGALIWLALMKPKPSETTIVQKIDLSGDVNLEQMKCRSCGGILNKDSITVNAGAIFIKCPYCGSAYQLEEAPKW
jgi:hypothetical protein